MYQPGLQITEHTCNNCGNEWTHSATLVRTGQNQYSYLSPRSPPVCVIPSAATHAYCHRCVEQYLGLHPPTEWPPYQPPKTKKHKIDVEDLLADDFSLTA